MKKQAVVKVRLSDEMLRKLLFLSEKEGRSINNQFLFLLRNSFDYFEKAKGRFDTKKMAAYDLSPYYEEDGQAENEG